MTLSCQGRVQPILNPAVLIDDKDEGYVVPRYFVKG